MLLLVESNKLIHFRFRQYPCEWLRFKLKFELKKNFRNEDDSIAVSVFVLPREIDNDGDILLNSFKNRLCFAKLIFSSCLPVHHFVSVGKWKRDDVHNLNPGLILIWKTNMIYWLYPGLRHLLNLASGTFPHIGSFLQSPCLFSFFLLSGVWFFAGLQKQIRQKAANSNCQYIYRLSVKLLSNRIKGRW